MKKNLNECILPFCVSNIFLIIIDTALLISFTSLSIECALLVTGTPVFLSKLVDIYCSAVADLAALVIAASDVLAPTLLNISLNSLFGCSLCKSQ